MNWEQVMQPYCSSWHLCLRTLLRFFHFILKNHHSQKNVTIKKPRIEVLLRRLSIT